MCVFCEGHEIIGTITALGSEVKHLQIGRVSLFILVFTKCVQKVHFFVRIIMLGFKSEK
jgi:threonine dehydrogenase-like Zn-dependent dehydrogenase